jgi:hypothetical protein
MKPMAKATRKNITKAKSKTSPREGLDLINAAHQRKTSPAPDFKRELRFMRNEGVETLVVLYDAYMAASNAILGIQNQPRAQGTEPLLNAECAYLIAKAWTVAEHLKGLRPTERDRANFVRVLTDCVYEMGGSAEDAASVFKAAMAVGTEDDRDWRPKEGGATKRAA